MNRLKVLLTTFVVAAMVFPTTVAAQSDLESLARDLERVLGKGRVEVRSTAARATTNRVATLSDRALVAALYAAR